MEKENNNKGLRLEEYTKLVEEYFELEKKYHDHLSQFFSVYIGGKMQNMATKGDN